MRCFCLQSSHICANTVLYLTVDCSVPYSSVTIACIGAYGIAFVPRPEVGRWPSDISGTVGPFLRQLGFLFCLAFGGNYGGTLYAHAISNRNNVAQIMLHAEIAVIQRQWNALESRFAVIFDQPRPVVRWSGDCIGHGNVGRMLAAMTRWLAPVGRPVAGNTIFTCGTVCEDEH